MKSIIIILLLFFSCFQSQASKVLGIDFYSNQLSSTLYQFHVDVYTATSPLPNYLSFNFDGGAFADTTIQPDTSYLVGINTYKSEYTINHVFSFAGTYKVAYWINNWTSDILNILDAVNQPAGDTAIVVNSPFIATNQFDGFTNDLLSGNFIGDDFTHDVSVTETDGDSIVIQQVNVGSLEPFVYTFPPTFFAASETLIGSIYNCYDISIAGKLAVEFEVNEYRMGILIATHQRLMTFDYGSIGLDEMINGTNLNIYPNPNNGNFKINLSEPIKGVLKIVNSFGQVITTKNLNNELVIDLNIASSPKGIYFISIQSGKGINTSKVIIE